MVLLLLISRVNDPMLASKVSTSDSSTFRELLVVPAKGCRSHGHRLLLPARVLLFSHLMMTGALCCDTGALLER